MPNKLYNLARMTTATVGTGTITLASAVSGYLTFDLAGVANADVVSYGIKDGANSEVGTGTYTTSGTTLTRTVTKSTNSNSAISLSGTAEVFITPRAEDLTVTTPVAKSDQTSATSNALAVTPLHQQDHDSAAKAWVNFDGATGTINISYNVTSVTRTATGDYKVNFTTPFASANYVGVATFSTTGNNGFMEGNQASTTASVFAMFAVNSATQLVMDPAKVHAVFYGRQ